MINLKTFEQHNEVDPYDEDNWGDSQDFINKKQYVLEKLSEFMEIYDEFTKMVSPQFWRTTGSHFSELRKMKADIPEYNEINRGEKENAEKLGLL